MRRTRTINRAVSVGLTIAVAAISGQCIAWLVVTEPGITLASAGRSLGACIGAAMIIGTLVGAEWRR